MNILPVFWPSASELTRLNWARFSIPVFGIIAAITALKVQTIYNLILDANAILLAAVVVPFMFGIWHAGANRTGALAGMIMGVMTWLVSSLVRPDLPGDLIGMVACFITMLVAIPLTTGIDPPRPLLTSDGEPVDLTNRLGVILREG